MLLSLKLSKVDTSVGKVEATDLDGDRLFYILTSPAVSPNRTCFLEAAINH